jgi:hypothetical protein
MRLEQDHRDLAFRQVAVLVEARVEPCELVPQRLLGRRLRTPRGDSDGDALGEDLRPGVSLQVQPPGRRAVIAGVGGQDREGLAVLEIPNRGRPALADFVRWSSGPGSAFLP